MACHHLIRRGLGMDEHSSTTACSNSDIAACGMCSGRSWDGQSHGETTVKFVPSPSPARMVASLDPVKNVFPKLRMDELRIPSNEYATSSTSVVSCIKARPTNCPTASRQLATLKHHTVVLVKSYVSLHTHRTREELMASLARLVRGLSLETRSSARL